MKRLTMLTLLAGLAMLAGGILYRGFYTLDENEFAVVVEYEAGELIGEPISELMIGKLENFRADLIAIIHEQHSGGRVRIVKNDDPSILPFLTPYGKPYWHLPPPFGKHYRINLKPHNYNLRIPLLAPVAVDQEDRPLMYSALTNDLDGNPLTKDPGFRLISAHDLFEIQFDPDIKLDVMMLEVKGEFKITSLENYALWVKDSYGQMDKLIEERGIFGEIVEALHGDELIEAYLSAILDVYVWEVKVSSLFERSQEKYPEVPPQALNSIVAERIMNRPAVLTDGFVDYLASEFVEVTGMDLEGGVGIDVLEEIVTEMHEEAI